jgi:hypothetical protein
MNEEPQASRTARAWLAVVLMAPLLAVLFLPSLALVHLFVDTSNSWADLAYLVTGALAYAVGVIVVLPVTAHTLGRVVDARTSEIGTVRAAGVFGLLAGAMGSVAAVPMTLEGNVGLAPMVTYVAAPALAAFVTRLLLPVALAHRGVRVTAYVLAALAMAPIAAYVATVGLSGVAF